MFIRKYFLISSHQTPILVVTKTIQSNSLLTKNFISQCGVKQEKNVLELYNKISE